VFLIPFPYWIFNSLPPPPPCIFRSSLDCCASIRFDPRTVQPLANHYTDWTTRPILIAIQVYNLTIYCYLICVLFWVCGCLCPVILCVSDPKMCVYTYNICNQEEFCVFFSSPNRQYMKLCECSWWEKYITLVHGYEWFWGACWISSQAIERWRQTATLYPNQMTWSHNL